MNKLAIGFAVAMAFVSFGCKKKGGGAGEAMAKMSEFKDKMCACKDTECATKVSKEMQEWGEKQAKNSKEPAKMSEADTKKATEISTAMGECMTKAMSAGATAPAGDKPADPAAAGDKPADPAAAAPAGDAAAETKAICDKLAELAKKEGGKAEQDFNSKLKDDCAKEMDEQRGKKGAAKVTEFKACLDKAENFTKATETCKQID